MKHHFEGAGWEGWNPKYEVIRQKLEAPEESKDEGQGQCLETLSEALERLEDSLESACGLAVERNRMQKLKVQILEQ